MEALAGFGILVSIMFGIVSLIGIIKPMRRIGLDSRIKALKVWIGACAIFVVSIIAIPKDSEEVSEKVDNTEINIQPVANPVKTSELVGETVKVDALELAEQRLSEFKSEYKRFSSRVDTGQASDKMYKYSEDYVAEVVKSDVFEKYSSIGLEIENPKSYDWIFIDARKPVRIYLSSSNEIMISHDVEWRFDYRKNPNNKLGGSRKFHFRVVSTYNVDKDKLEVEKLEIIDPEKYYADFRYSHRMPFLKSVELFNEYMANEVRAARKYKDRKIRVNGIVRAIMIDPQGNPVVGLGSEEDIIAVRANFTKSSRLQVKKVGELKRGDDLVVECVVAGIDKDNNVHLNESRIVGNVIRE